jgi:peptidoglycan-associated lipoprotein
MRDKLMGGERTMKVTVLRMVTVASLTTSMALFAAGCGKKQVRTDEGLATQPVAPVQEPVRETGLGGEEPLSSAGQYGDTAAISEGRTHAPMLPVYFNFDQSSIRADQQPRIEKNSDFLKDNPEAMIRIEGNCDERGTNEYNMALGERRAVSAKKYLMNLGIAEHRITTISYGEERPLTYGNDELSWAQNRRADFVLGR